MIYQFTGQPGHGKTLQAINLALEFQKNGRIVYVCNVRDFDYEKTGMLPMTPEEFRNWMAFLPDGAVCLVDECYEKGMLPKRAASQKLPEHVERLATHRHKGIDFIFVCQSPDKQMDSFVHDLIDEHVHVRRKFGTQFQNLLKYDRYERNPLKGSPTTVKRVRFPKHVFGLYKSTELDTTQKKIPWYLWVFAIGGPLGLLYAYWVFAGMGERLAGPKSVEGAPTEVATGAVGHGALATGTDAPAPPMTATELIERFTPRVESQPWSAPAYDGLAVPADPPRVFCMSSAPSYEDELSTTTKGSCTCMTEQGTRYVMKLPLCYAIARRGQYEPYYDEQSQRLADAQTLMETSSRQLQQLQDAKESQFVIPRASGAAEVFPRSEGYKPTGSYLELETSKGGPRG